MTEKLPVKTFRLKRRKIYGVWAGIVISLCLSILSFIACQHTTLGTGYYIFSMFSLVFFGLCIFSVLSAIHLYREKYVGFFISTSGFNDISTGQHYGVVFWRDVQGIRVIDDLIDMRYKYIVILVKDPQMYIDREPLQRKKRSLLLKLHYYGSPICFSNRGLECDFDELLETVRLYYSEES